MDVNSSLGSICFSFVSFFYCVYIAFVIEYLPAGRVLHICQYIVYIGSNFEVCSAGAVCCTDGDDIWHADAKFHCCK